MSMDGIEIPGLALSELEEPEIQIAPELAPATESDPSGDPKNYNNRRLALVARLCREELGMKLAETKNGSFFKAEIPDGSARRGILAAQGEIVNHNNMLVQLELLRSGCNGRVDSMAVFRLLLRMVKKRQAALFVQEREQ